MNKKLIVAVVALGLFVPAPGRAVAAPTLASDTLFLGGAIFPIPEDAGVPQSVIIPNLNVQPFLLVQLYQDSSLTVLSDQLFTFPNAAGNTSLRFESDPDLQTLPPLFTVLKVAETGGVQDFSSFFGFPVAVQSDNENVPEPASLALLGIGALGMAGYGWRRRKTAAA